MMLSRFSYQLITDSGFAGLDAGLLRMAKELEAPGRMNRAGLIGIAQAKRLLHQVRFLQPMF